jgi:cytochrome c oxidase subunit III
MNAFTSSKPARGTAPQVKPRPNTGLLGAFFFILSESMFFLALFLAYFYLRTDSRNWPFMLIRPALGLPIFNTALLAVSVIAIAWAEHGIARGDQRRLTIGVAVAAIFGLLFMGIQSVEFAELMVTGLAPGGSSFGSSFFALLVFHVLRVFAGVSFMVIVLIRSLLRQFNRNRRAAVQACALYWYFIAAVWVVVFLLLFVVR